MVTEGMREGFRQGKFLFEETWCADSIGHGCSSLISRSNQRDSQAVSFRLLRHRVPTRNAGATFGFAAGPANTANISGLLEVPLRRTGSICIIAMSCSVGPAVCGKSRLD